MNPRVAIIGSGPAGIYCADALTRLSPEIEIDIFERQPYAFGLLRCAVAPDHLATKGLLKIFDRVVSKSKVKLHLGVVVGEDLSVEHLERVYDGVVVAAGAGGGRTLDIERAPGVRALTAFDFARAFNGCGPASLLPQRRSISHVCIVGGGNASLDVARLLISPTEDLRRLGVPEPVLDWHESLDLASVQLLARGTAASVKFSPSELAALERHPAWNMVSLCYARTPLRQTSSALVCEDAYGKSHSVQCDLLVEAIGQRPTQIAGLPVDAASGAVSHCHGLVTGRRTTFALGWSAGHQLNIAAMREEAKAIAQAVHKTLEPQQAV